MIQTVDNPGGIPRVRYRGYMTAVNTDGGMLFLYQGCKESFLFYYNGIGIKRGASSYGTNGCRDGEIDIDNPRLFMAVGDSYKTRPVWMAKTMNLLTRVTGLEIKTYHMPDAWGVMVEPDPIFISNSVALHGLLTFMRAGLNGSGDGPHDTTDIYKFIKSVISHNRIAGSNDGRQISRAEDNDNLFGFLNLNLPIFEEGFDGWNIWEGGSYSTPGLVSYRSNRHKSRETPVEASEILSMYGGVPAINPPGDNYRNWGYTTLHENM